MTTSRDDREQLFALLSSPTTAAGFFDRVADDVDWTIVGTHPIAGRYQNKKRLMDEAIVRLNSLAVDGARLELAGLIVDRDMAVAELRHTATSADGGTYVNDLCWVCRFDSTNPGATVVEVREYLDSAMVTWMINHNEHSVPR